MRSLVLLALPLLALPTERADASGCFTGPFTTTFDPPLGCPVVIYERQQTTDLRIRALRDTDLLDVTGDITIEETLLGVLYQNFGCDGRLSEERTVDEMYTVQRVMLDGAEVGDKLSAGMELGTVQPAGPCVESERPKPFCSATNSGYPCPGNDAGAGGSNDEMPGSSGGCDAAGGSAGIALALLAFTQRRRRHRAR